MWTVVNERDELGSDLVPDYLTSVHDGAFYGWPYSYYGQHVDARVQPPRPDLVARAIAPDYALGPHVAALGLASSDGSTLPAPFVGGLFIGLHGSWNRKPRSGYKVVFVPFDRGRPSGPPVDVLTGFLNAGRRRPGAAGRRRDRQDRRAAGRRRCRQHSLARCTVGECSGDRAAGERSVRRAIERNGRRAFGERIVPALNRGGAIPGQVEGFPLE